MSHLARRTALPLAMRWLLRVTALGAALALVLSPAASATPVAAQGGGFTIPFNYMPSADVTDGRFIAQAGTGLETLVAVGTEFELVIPANSLDTNGKWRLGIFDGDSGKDATGTVTTDFNIGHWDLGTTELQFALFADPDGTVDPDVDTPLYSWLGNSPAPTLPGVSYSASAMPDNEWFDITLPTDPGAVNADGDFQYRLCVKVASPAEATTRFESSFRLRSTGRIRTEANRPFQFVAPARNKLDWETIYPAWTFGALPQVLTPTTYDGGWSIFVELPAGENRLDIWEGDFDHGSADPNSQNPFSPDVIPGTEDTDDPDSPAFPPFFPQLTGDQVSAEGVSIGQSGAAGLGAPPDDSWPVFTRGPAVRYDVVDPNGNVWANDNPSGNREWEKFTLATPACNCAADADYVVPALPAGFYEIRIQGHDLDNINAMLLGQDSWITRIDGKASLGNTVWLDSNADGVLDGGESGIAGVMVKVYRDVNADGIRQPGEPMVGTDTTDANGNYLVTGLADGQYIVEVDSANFGAGGALDGLLQTRTTGDQTLDGTNKVLPFVARIIDKTDNLTADFGFAAPAALGDYVWLDANGDGLQDAGETGVAGVNVELWLDVDGNGAFDATLDTLTSTTVTGPGGQYNFGNLRPVDYLVVIPGSEFTGPLFAFQATTANFGADDTVDSDGVDNGAGGLFTAVALLPGQTDLTNDFGLVFGGGQSAAFLGDTVWQDDNQNGVQDGSEVGIDGVVLNIYFDWDATAGMAGDGAFDGDELLLGTATTSGGGGYLVSVPFNGPGVDYFVEVAPENFLAGGALDTMTATPVQGLDGQTAATGQENRPSPYLAPMGISVFENLTADFGFVPTGGSVCYQGVVDPTNVGATVDWTVNANGTVTVRVTLARTFADTAFGTGAPVVGWPGKGRKFDQIVGSDKLELTLTDGNGAQAMRFTMDLLAIDASAPSGYATAGIASGPSKSDGSIAVGSAGDVLSVRTSISENMNNTAAYGAGGWTDLTSSPATDANYVGGAAAAAWDWDTWYEATIDLAAFGAAGFGAPSIASLHSSPAKTGDKAPVVEPCVPDGNVTPPPPADCAQCQGKVTDLTMQYNGTTVADVTVLDKKGNPVFGGTFQPGDQFSLVGADKKGTLGTEIKIYVNGVLNATIHTSCSQPIGPGLVAGDFEVISGSSLDGGLLCPLEPPTSEPPTAEPPTPPPDCAQCSGKVTDLTMQYLGTTVDAAITVLDKKGNPVFGGTFQPGDQFSLVGTDKKGTLGTEIKIYVNGVLNATIHTSCSQPIGPGLVAGDFEVISGSSLDGGLLCPLEPATPEPPTAEPPTPEPPCEECKDGVTSLTLRYLGDDETTVLVVTKKDGKIILRGDIGPGEELVIEGEKGHDLGDEIEIYLLDATFQTDCSVAIGPGLVSGSFEVVEGKSGDGDLCPVE